MTLWQKSATELAQLLENKEVSATEVAQSHLDRTNEAEPLIDAYLSRTSEAALRHATRVDGARSSDDQVHRASGIPVALKDAICTKGMRTTAASKILETYKPPYDATVWERLQKARTILMGKTNLDEFAMGSSTENSAYKTTRNPWDTSRVPGGSSGGSAAAVAAGMVPWALGSDTGGSIRQPASLCGVVGLKPTYGLVSRYGLIAFASSLDQIGPITRTVTDAAWMLEIISGHDPKDSTSIVGSGSQNTYVEGIDSGINGLKVGIVDDLMGEGIDSNVRDSITEVARKLEGLGATVTNVSLPWFSYALDAYYLIAPAEASSNLARYDGIRYGLRVEGPDVASTNRATREAGFGPEVKRRILLGTYALSSGYYDAWYGRALKIRTRIIQDLNFALSSVDLLLSPTSPTVAFEVGAKAQDPMSMYLSDVCTIPMNLSGGCAISIPCGTADGLPIGAQLMGQPLQEKKLLQAAYALEQVLGFDSSGGFIATQGKS